MAEEKNATSSPAVDEHAEKAPSTADAQPDNGADVEMKDAPVEEVKKEATDASETAASASKEANEPAASVEPKAEDTAAGAPSASAAPASTPVDKSKGRRKSGPFGSVKKKLQKKGSKAKILHLDAKPGDHFLVKLKGYPTWPVIVCSEDMLSEPIIRSRPVSAAAADGTYRHDYADGGKRAPDRTFPVMYLQTNEFGWVPNSDFHTFDPSTIMKAVSDKMRKDLQAAHQLASEQHPLDFYKSLLVTHEKEIQELAEAKAAALEKKAKKSKAVSPEEEDVPVADATEDDGPKPKSRKRKAEDDGKTPKGTDSVKKPKIKLTTTPKAGANGLAGASKGSKDNTKNTKLKAKKANEEKKQEAPKEVELTAEEKHARREKEVLFLRHKLQRGLLTRDQEPKEDEMVTMSEYLTQLEALPDLEAGIIKTTKINKVLKAMLKLESIPKEEEFHFKPRSQTMLDKWNRILAGGSAPVNGVNGTSDKDKSGTNGVKKEPGEGEDKPAENGHGEVAEGDVVKKEVEDEAAEVQPKIEKAADEAETAA